MTFTHGPGPTIDVSCLACGRPLRTLAPGRAFANTEAHIVLKCTGGCAKEWVLEVFLRPTEADLRYARMDAAARTRSRRRELVAS